MAIVKANISGQVQTVDKIVGKNNVKLADLTAVVDNDSNLTITQNGTYTATKDGFKTVTANVSTQGSVITYSKKVSMNTSGSESVKVIGYDELNQSGIDLTDKKTLSSTCGYYVAISFYRVCDLDTESSDTDSVMISGHRANFPQGFSSGSKVFAQSVKRYAAGGTGVKTLFVSDPLVETTASIPVLKTDGVYVNSTSSYIFNGTYIFTVTVRSVA